MFINNTMMSKHVVWGGRAQQERGISLIDPYDRIRPAKDQACKGSGLQSFWPLHKRKVARNLLASILIRKL